MSQQKFQIQTYLIKLNKILWYKISGLLSYPQHQKINDKK